MSQAGARSERGDEYQLRVALPWILRLWTDPAVVAIQTESIGMPGDGSPPLVDDIVVVFEDGRRLYVQAKKNHPRFGEWSFRDREMRAELLKARVQLERDETGTVRFVSRSAFGVLHRLAEGARDYPDAETFANDAPATLTGPLRDLTALWERTDEEAFWLVRRVYATITGDYEEMDHDALAALRMLFARPEEVQRLLESRLRSHQSRLRNPVVVYTRAELERELGEAGHVPSPQRSVADGRAEFERASAIGRAWVRTLGGEPILRSETDDVLAAIAARHRTVLVEGEPGVGKTCVMLDVAGALEARDDVALLFIKGDRFGGAVDEHDLVRLGLPDEIVGRCSRLSVHLPVVVMIDALDVLSIQRIGGTLSLFLGLVDRLSRVENVTVVTSCRPYDLRYDTQLRGRTWEARVTVGRLSVERDVRPVLARWGVGVECLDEALVELLRVPSRLWLYGEILRDGPVERVGSVYELHDRYLASVQAEPGWGEAAPAVLAQVAARMQKTRRLDVPSAEIDAPPGVLHGLLSRGVLREAERGLVFAHQELLDVVAVRAAQRRGESLREWIASQPALPFVRPTVRVFMHVLRDESPERYRREVWAVLDDDETPYHLRRLAAETLAEIRPTAADLPLLRRLMAEHGDLFSRFLVRAGAETWLETVVDGLLPSARRVDDSERWTARLLGHLGVWVAARPDAVLAVWRRAVEDAWPGTDDLARTVAGGLEKALREAEPGRLPWPDADWLLHHLLGDPALVGHASHAVGPAVQAWVDAGGDDEVLLEFLVLGEEPEDGRHDLEKRIRSLRSRGETSVVPSTFLSTRMAASDAVVDAALSYAVDQGSRKPWGGGLLGETSWRARHNQCILPHDGLHDVLGALEDALEVRASRGDAWWQAHEPWFLSHDDPGVRYLAFQAYARDPAAHGAAVSRVLTDPSTFDLGDLETEVRELARDVYPCLGSEVIADHQRLVLSAVDGLADDAEPWRRRVAEARAYDHLTVLPAPDLLPRAQAFLDGWERRHGNHLPAPRLQMVMTIGEVPFATGNELVELSDAGVSRVVDLWEAACRDEGHRPDPLARAMAAAATQAPHRALIWVEALYRRGASPEILAACVEGIARHLRIQFGGLTFNGDANVPTSPVPGPELARRLLGLMERFSERGQARWIDDDLLSEGALACADVVVDKACADRTTALLARLSRTEGSPLSGNTSAMLEGSNTVRGKAAAAAVRLAVRLAEAERGLPELLPPVLRSLASDGQRGTAWAVLHGLPPLTQSDPDLGWGLLDRATAHAGQAEWEAAEMSLYYAYHHYPDRVEPVLARIRAGALDVAGRTYGRIGTLSVLSGHLDTAPLLSALRGGPSSVWAGMAEVYAVNLDGTHREACVEGLVGLLTSPGVPSAAVNEVSRVLSRDASRPSVPPSVIEALLQRAPGGEEYGLRVHAVGLWAQDEVTVRPRAVLTVLERLSAGAETGRFSGLYGHEIVSALAALLREADETDDERFISRVVAVQDALLRAGIGDVDEMLDEASRP